LSQAFSSDGKRIKMRNKLSKLLIAAGALMVLSALILCISNIMESRRAAKFSADAVKILKEKIPEEPESLPDTENNNDDLFRGYEEKSVDSDVNNVIEIDGYSYCGYLTIDALGIELPVMDDFSYPHLKRSPCRFSGSAETDDLIIAAHNYSSHFGRLKELSPGDMIVFTRADGKRFNYMISYLEELDGGDGDKLQDGAGEEWALTLFTCTLSGKKRVTVRAEYADNTSDRAE